MRNSTKFATREWWIMNMAWNHFFADFEWILRDLKILTDIIDDYSVESFWSDFIFKDSFGIWYQDKKVITVLFNCQNIIRLPSKTAKLPSKVRIAVLTSRLNCLLGSSRHTCSIPHSIIYIVLLNTRIYWQLPFSA